jgi:hypothetical protein
MPWIPFEEGQSIGQPGSESGTILLDEEYESGARITLERGGTIAPLAITCGIYGWAFHTRFFGPEEEARAQYAAMKDGLAAIVDAIPLESDPDVAAKNKAVTKEIERFVEKYP